MPFDGKDAGIAGSSAPPRPTLEALRHAVARIEGVPAERLTVPDDDRCRSSSASGAGRIALGAAEADRMLGGGVPEAGLSEIRTDAARDGGAGIGFALALAVRLGVSRSRPLLWITPAGMRRETGFAYAPGLASFGLDASGFVGLETRRLEDAAWAGEEAARSGAATLTVLEVQGNPALLSLEGTRRLHLRAKASARPLLLLRQGGRAETTAAPLRLHLAPAAAAPVADLADPRFIGRLAFVVRIEKATGLRPDTMLLEWNSHDRRFSDRFDGSLSGAVAAAPFDGPDPARTAGAVVAFETGRARGSEHRRAG